MELNSKDFQRLFHNCDILIGSGNSSFLPHYFLKLHHRKL